jgi:hypothetical protein
MKLDDLLSALGHLKKTAEEIFYGFSSYELELEMKKDRGHMEDLFLLIASVTSWGCLFCRPITPCGYFLT